MSILKAPTNRHIQELEAELKAELNKIYETEPGPG